MSFFFDSLNPREWFPKNRKKTPFIMQMDAVECGAAALAMVLGHYGRFVQLTQLRVDCGVSRDGSKASNILKAARLHGLKAKGFSKGLKTLRAVRLPAIVYWEFNHFLVLEGFTDRTVFLNDPALGHRRMTWEEFSDGFTGVVLCFEPGEDFQPEGRLPSPFPLLWARTRGSRKALLYATLCGLIGVFPGITSAAFTRVVVDSVIVDLRFDWLRPLLVVMVLVSLFKLALDTLSALFFRRLELGLSAKLHGEFYRHLLGLPYLFYCQRYVGEVVDRAQVNDMIVGLLAGKLTRSLIGIFTLVFFGAVLMSYSPELTSIGVIATVLDFAMLHAIGRRRQEANLRIAKQSGKVQAAAIAGVGSIDSLKASGMEDAFFETWSGLYAAASNSRQELALESRWFSVLPTITSTSISTVTLLLGGFRVMEGQMTLGTLMAFNALMGTFLSPMKGMLGLATELQMIRGNLTRLEDVMACPAQVSAFAVPESRPPSSLLPGDHQGGLGDGQGVLPRVRLEGALACRGVSFGYSPLDPPLVAGFDLDLAPGERVALVGASGSGKTTLGRILAGILEPWEGEVLFDNRPRVQIPRDLWVNSLAMIEQDFALFPGSVRENLTLWDPTVPDEWLVEACRDACILDDVMALPGGLSANLLERGGNLSGGQRQRLEIARALVRNPTVLVLDEATSALDPSTEAEVLESIRRRGATVVMVAHRLSTIRDCHQILLLSKGRVIERGTHRQLWEAGGAYTRLLEA